MNNELLNGIVERNNQRKIEAEQKKIIGKSFLNEYDAKIITDFYGQTNFVNIDKTIAHIFDLLCKLSLSEKNKTTIYDLILCEIRRK